MSTNEINLQIVEQLKSLTDQDFKGNLIIIEPGNIRGREKDNISLFCGRPYGNRISKT